jgi:hypothetical protein
MKGLIKIGLVIAVIYLAYNYYKKNYTKEGRIGVLEDLKEEDLMYKDAAERLKQAWISEQVALASEGLPSFIKSQVEAVARTSYGQEADNIDWISRAKALS